MYYKTYGKGNRIFKNEEGKFYCYTELSKKSVMYESCRDIEKAIDSLSLELTDSDGIVPAKPGYSYLTNLSNRKRNSF